MSIGLTVLFGSLRPVTKTSVFVGTLLPMNSDSAKLYVSRFKSADKSVPMTSDPAFAEKLSNEWLEMRRASERSLERVEDWISRFQSMSPQDRHAHLNLLHDGTTTTVWTNGDAFDINLLERLKSNSRILTDKPKRLTSNVFECGLNSLNRITYKSNRHGDAAQTGVRFFYEYDGNIGFECLPLNQDSLWPVYVNVVEFSNGRHTASDFIRSAEFFWRHEYCYDEQGRLAIIRECRRDSSQRHKYLQLFSVEWDGKKFALFEHRPNWAAATRDAMQIWSGSADLVNEDQVRDVLKEIREMCCNAIVDACKTLDCVNEVWGLAICIFSNDENPFKPSLIACRRPLLTEELSSGQAWAVPAFEVEVTLSLPERFESICAEALRQVSDDSDEQYRQFLRALTRKVSSRLKHLRDTCTIVSCDLGSTDRVRVKLPTRLGRSLS
ncbi:MAG TPA: hypothetical protein V6D17_10110 [Candidatus Obscuribacterales bacterium]